MSNYYLKRDAERERESLLGKMARLETILAKQAQANSAPVKITKSGMTLFSDAPSQTTSTKFSGKSTSLL